MSIEETLKELFDYQKFEENRELERFIQDAENRYAKELSDEDLNLVNAAGEIIVESGLTKQDK
ncbi:MAG: hypothetical protein Q4E99_04335 [Bacillota bacterium]|nr:hypothetical protein [Bacillota bacterium]